MYDDSNLFCGVADYPPHVDSIEQKSDVFERVVVGYSFKQSKYVDVEEIYLEKS